MRILSRNTIPLVAVLLAAAAAPFVPALAGEPQEDAPPDLAQRVETFLDDARSSDDLIRQRGEDGIFALGDSARSELERLARDPDQKRAMAALRLLASPRWDRAKPEAESPPKPEGPVWPGTKIRIVGGAGDQVGKEIEAMLRAWQAESEKHLAEARKLLDDARSRFPKLEDLPRIDLRGGGATSGTVVRDGNRFSWEEQADGRVKVTVKDGDREEQTYEAANREELRRKHPDVAKRLDEIASVNTWTLRGFPHAVDIDRLVPLPLLDGSLVDSGGWWKRATERAAPEKGLLGILWEPPSDVLRAQLSDQMGGKPGMVVTSVTQDSLAARLGLERHDVLLRLAGRDVASPEDVRGALDSVADGGTVEAEFIRRGRRETRSSAK
ncbi:MAG: hypothetical protein HMLKMBBP_03046 [Planctomycetes bacterium]|nr:hypothetical protein [Planctomycetota bacterium]